MERQNNKETHGYADYKTMQATKQAQPRMEITGAVNHGEVDKDGEVEKEKQSAMEKQTRMEKQSTMEKQTRM